MAGYRQGDPTFVEPDDDNVVIVSAEIRKGDRTIYNASDKRLALGLGFEPTFEIAAPGASIIMASLGYFEVPFSFRGIIYGLFEDAAVGYAQTTVMS